MAVSYSVSKMNSNFGDKTDGKFYAHAQINGTTSLKQFSQLIASQTTVSRADVAAVLISSVENLVMELQRGNQVEFGELGKFRLQITSKGAEKAADFKSDTNITGVNVQFVPGEDLNDLFSKLEFTPVASRLIQKAALKAEKEQAKTLDLDAIKASGKKNNGNDDSDKGGSTTGGSTSGGSGSTGDSGSSTGDSGSSTGDSGSSAGGSGSSSSDGDDVGIG